MNQLNVYLTFQGNCREAMTFYNECMGGTLTMQTVAESPVANQCPESVQDQLLHSTLSFGNFSIMASDMIGPAGYRSGNNVSLCIDCSSEDEINKLYNSLSAGGEILDALKVQFWGALFGEFYDKFGIRWMLNCEKK
jgi:PhnB protein